MRTDKGALSRPALARTAMGGDYSVYDSLYAEARRNGWRGWGGDARIASGPAQLRQILGKPYVPARGRALELGCGEGHLCRLLSRQGFAVTGVDVSTVAVNWAMETRAEAPIRYVQADLCQPGVLQGECFDLVVDGNCLHCIIGEDRAAFLLNVGRFLSTGGVFFVSSLCSKDGGSLTVERAGQPYRHVPSIADLLRELDQARFDVLDWAVQVREEFNHIHLFARKGG